MPQIPSFGTNFPTPDGAAIRDYIHISTFTVDAHHSQFILKLNSIKNHSSFTPRSWCLVAENVTKRIKMDLNPYGFEVIILEYGVGSFIS